MSIREGVKAACLPCALGHLSTSAGLLNEAYRFRNEGLTSPEILDRVAKVIEEQNSLERVDLSPEKLEGLDDWERELAEEAAEKSREIRHRLENFQSLDDLAKAAADVETYYKRLNRDYNSRRLGDCPDCVDRARDLGSALTVDVDVDSPARRREKFLQEIRRRK